MSWRLVGLLVLIATLMVVAALKFGEKVPPSAKTMAKPGDYASLVGKKAPDFSLNDLSGKTFKLSDQRGKKVVLFFNEGIMCYPACWDQMAALGTDSQLNSGEVVSASIVTDDRSRWDSTVKKMPDLTKGIVLFDTDKNISTEYGVLSLASSMHRGTMPGHTYVIVDKQGVVRYTKDDPGMGIHNTELISEIIKI